MCLTLDLPFLESARALQVEADLRHSTSTRSHISRSEFNDWRFRSDSADLVANVSEILRAFSGVIMVGDSQMREVAWAALLLLVQSAELSFAAGDPHLGPPDALRRASACSSSFPQMNTGWSALCNFSGHAASPQGACILHSPPGIASLPENAATRLNPHWIRSEWNGSLVGLDERVCGAEFFVSFEAIRGSGAIDPESVPRCLSELRRERPILWLAAGGGLQELATRNVSTGPPLPRRVLRRFQPHVLHRSVVWLPVGGGFRSACDAANRCTLHQSRGWLKGHGGQTVRDLVPLSRAERRWCASHGVRSLDYFGLTQMFGNAMNDGRHFSYYLKKCSQTFPELPKLVAQLALQAALRPLDRQVEACAPRASAYRVAPQTVHGRTEQDEGSVGFCAPVWSYRQRRLQERRSAAAAEHAGRTTPEMKPGGSWPVGSFEECLERCVLCVECPCRYVSYGHADHDCTWFRRCLPPERLHRQFYSLTGHRSYRVRHRNGTLAAWVHGLRRDAELPDSRELIGSPPIEKLAAAPRGPESEAQWPSM
jgi:hypothetical protein